MPRQLKQFLILTVLGLVHVYLISRVFAFSEHSSPPSTFVSLSKRKVAVVISITHENHSRFGVDYIDMVAPLAQSVFEWNQKSLRYQLDLIAFVPPTANSSLVKLNLFGFRVLKTSVPVGIKDIAPGTYRERVDRSGCCGLGEFMKLHAFNLVEYHRVVHVDTDVIFLQPIEEVLDLEDDVGLVYTNSTLAGELFSGGFFIIRPSKKTFKELVEIIKTGEYSFRNGWGKSGIGRCWGGETIQGLMPYYFLKYLPERNPKAPKAIRLDRCIYNFQGSPACRNAIPLVEISKVKVSHFTVCQKPVTCRELRHVPHCAYMIDRWWNLSFEIQDRLEFARTNRCAVTGRNGMPRKYQPILLDSHLKQL